MHTKSSIKHESVRPQKHNHYAKAWRFATWAETGCTGNLTCECLHWNTPAQTIPSHPSSVCVCVCVCVCVWMHHYNLQQPGNRVGLYTKRKGATAFLQKYNMTDDTEQMRPYGDFLWLGLMAPKFNLLLGHYLFRDRRFNGSFTQERR